MKKGFSREKAGKTFPVPPAAAALADQYRVVIEARGRDGFSATSIEMPGVFAHARTEAECIARIRRALSETIAIMLDTGEAPPRPASSGAREVQLNIRVTSDERSRILERARLAGYRSISEYIRRAALRGVA
ncbi:hypothetical protein PHYC_01589 [Phycisphaerales bacterium]|nr:hypothetical protein PHYC_01589 [Phycisphaerales bacterium]